MKAKAGPKQDTCPKCGKWDMVLGMKTGSANVYGCLRCRNAQGIHEKMRDAKAAWKQYCKKG